MQRRYHLQIMTFEYILIVLLGVLRPLFLAVDWKENRGYELRWSIVLRSFKKELIDFTTL